MFGILGGYKSNQRNESVWQNSNVSFITAYLSSKMSNIIVGVNEVACVVIVNGRLTLNTRSSVLLILRHKISDGC